MKPNNIIDKKNFLKGTLVAVIMISLFSWIGGLPLVVTFVPGLIFSWVAFFYIFKYKIELPPLQKFLPLFILVLSWQFIHFNEEFITGFYKQFPELYGTMPYSKEKFVTINMISYSIFIIGSVVVYKTKYTFLLVPMLFFIIYGAIGNAIAHTYWSISLQRYFPGLFTAQAYWVLGPLALYKLIQNKKVTGIIIISFAVILISMIAYFAQ